MGLNRIMFSRMSDYKKKIRMRPFRKPRDITIYFGSETKRLTWFVRFFFVVFFSVTVKSKVLLGIATNRDGIFSACYDFETATLWNQYGKLVFCLGYTIGLSSVWNECNTLYWQRMMMNQDEI